MDETEAALTQRLHAESKSALEGGPKVANLRKHLQTLRGMSREIKMTPQHLEATVMMAVSGRILPRRANAKMGKLGRIRRNMGQENLFLEFEAFLQGALDGVYFTAHGYTTTRLGDRNPEELFAGMRALVAVFKDLGYDVFANSGTLLGLIRDKAPIAHDDDIDLAVVLNANTDVGAAREFSALADKLIERGFGDQTLRENGAILKLPKIAGFQVDVFPAYGARKRYKVYPYSFGDFPRSAVLPLGICTVSGLPIPANPEVVLQTNYGSGWKIPDPRFSFPWPRQKKKFTNFLTEWDRESQ
jgi:hypothetical protein